MVTGLMGAYADEIIWTVGISYDGSDGPTERVKDGDTYTLPECEIVPDGMSFKGWVMGVPSDKLTILQPGDTVIVDQTMVFHPLYGMDVVEGGYTLHLLSNFHDVFQLNGEPVASGRPIVVSEGEAVVITAEYIDGLSLYSLSVEGVDSPEKGDLRWLYREQYDTGIENPGLHFDMPGNDVSIIVLYYRHERIITFDANGGSGSMDQIATRMPTFVLPECGFTPPEGKVFDAWKLPYEGKASMSYPGVRIDVWRDLEIVALWKDDPDYEPQPEEPETHTHELSAVAGTEATCDTPGTEAYWKCITCGKLFADADATKEIAGPAEIPAGHDWGEWMVTKEPTATEEGEKTRICKRDPSHTETELIPVVKTPGEYSPVYGADATWSADDGEGLTFIIKRAVDDDTTYSHFLGASVDGVAVPPLGYDVQQGSLELTLKPAYLASLATGTHKLTVTFDDGTVDVIFTTAAASGEDGEVAPTPAKGGLPAWAWILIGVGALAVAGAAALAILRVRAKRQAAALRHGSGSHAVAGTHAPAQRRDTTLTDHYRRR
ncbi:MAG: hypothetical protein IIZ15_01570, partial [Coriobacteriales bacterium]|nr:hypothetical protein [Coriobacteriales bacterium]